MMPAVGGKRVTRRREETRARLLAAAYEVFAEDGFGRATVEKVCERAGFTRGAFYSNFTSLDELFLAMWEQRSAAMVAGVAAALDELAAGAEPGLTAMVARFEQAVPVEEPWYRITAEFTTHALRNPALRRVTAAREEAIVAALMPTVVAALARTGRAVPDPAALGRALVAVHDGTSLQIVLAPDDPAVRRERTELFRRVVLAYSTPRRTTTEGNP
ncbi:TetR/AcrR family transcriptional regulator [Nocardia asteroides]|uniref:TetR/AcrR family transcriptional regulator n=1 Tax=Nocardia asteroides TaxID=1824 RepID=UPI001E42DEE3|nr:TetR/AcrR family transcriptional regulator [Nocardia asteroides]UGT61506.1 TetR/AcrR family transcriptional regulator; helix-turn-helix transcriptional regulator [Nocardia asteroides]